MIVCLLAFSVGAFLGLGGGIITALYRIERHLSLLVDIQRSRR